MVYQEVYFWTATISKWQHLLKEDQFKITIVECLSYLSVQNKIKVYGFVIMPNHVHIIWEMVEPNGKEKPYESFLKFTSHQFQKILHRTNPNELCNYLVDESTRKHRYWKRDSLAVKMLSRDMLQQKLEYLHNNPLQSHWNLSLEPEQYHFSSAYDYANNFTRFNFLHHYFDRV